MQLRRYDFCRCLDGKRALEAFYVETLGLPLDTDPG